MTTLNKHQAFVKEYARIVDELKDPQVFSNTLFTEDAEFTIGNSPSNFGRDSIAACAAGMYSLCVDLLHTADKVYTVDENCFISEGHVTYTVKNGKPLDPIPLVCVYNLQPGTNLIKKYRAYLDLAPLLIAQGRE